VIAFEFPERARRRWMAFVRPSTPTERSASFHYRNQGADDAGSVVGVQVARWQKRTALAGVSSLDWATATGGKRQSRLCLFLGATHRPRFPLVA